MLSAGMRACVRACLSCGDPMIFWEGPCGLERCTSGTEGGVPPLIRTAALSLPSRPANKRNRLRGPLRGDNGLSSPHFERNARERPSEIDSREGALRHTETLLRTGGLTAERHLFWPHTLPSAHQFLSFLYFRKPTGQAPSLYSQS